LDEDETLALPILRDEADAFVHGLPRAADVDLHAVEDDLPGCRGPVLAEDRGDELGPARAHEARDAEDLAFAEVEGHPLDHFAIRVVRVGGMHPFDPEDYLAGLPVALGEALLHRAADHEAHDLLERELLGRLRGDDLSVAEHGHRVRYPEELLELVGYVYAGDAELLQRGEYFHQLVHLGLGKSRGGLVEDEDVRL